MDMIHMEWPAALNGYEKLVIRMNTLRVVIDNAVCGTATLVKVDSISRGKQESLLEAVQVLADLNLSVRKAYISSDGRWFMDVFHVTDRYGRKLTDDSVISSYIEHSLKSDDDFESKESTVHPLLTTTLELSGADRPGILSEVFAVLSDLSCSVVEAKVWTHNNRIASVMSIKDVEYGSPVQDSHKIDLITTSLQNILNKDRDNVMGAATMAVSSSATTGLHMDRRLHQLMFVDCGYELRSSTSTSTSSSQPLVSVQNWRGYSVISVKCPVRAKLLFDIVCTLTDMEYVVFHGTVDTNLGQAHLEFYVRHLDATPISSEAERQRVILCLQAAIERRGSEGVRLDLCTTDQQGLIAQVTRTFRENGLTVTKAEISTKGSKAVSTFYVSDVAGNSVDFKTIDNVIERIGADRIKVVGEQKLEISQKLWPVHEESGLGLNYLGSFVERNLYNLLIRSCS